jgi:hypothetical protein
MSLYMMKSKMMKTRIWQLTSPYHGTKWMNPMKHTIRTISRQPPKK